MATDDGAEHPAEGRVKELLDRLAEILRQLPPDRQEAFREYLDGKIKQEGEADDGRDVAKGNREKR